MATNTATKPQTPWDLYNAGYRIRQTLINEVESRYELTTPEGRIVTIQDRWGPEEASFDVIGGDPADLPIDQPWEYRKITLITEFIYFMRKRKS